MANTQDIRVKINSTKKTQQTTKAMKMVSAAKLRRAQERIVNARPYAFRINEVVQMLASSSQVEHSLLGQPSSDGKMLLVVLTSDRGLCGAFNNSIIRYAKQFYDDNQGKKIDFIFVGKKGAEYFRKQCSVEPIDIITNLVHEISYPVAEKLSNSLLKYFEQGEYTEIRVIYNEFKSAISQKVTDEVLLPVKKETELKEQTTDIIFELPTTSLLDQMLRKHFAVQIYRCLQESVASEHGSRMSAMENATRNAGEMINQMTLMYNKIRQAAITTELIEITSGAEALKN